MRMRGSSTIAVILLTTLPCASFAPASRAFDETRYPDWRGQWVKRFLGDFGPNPSFDPHHFGGLEQHAPLTPQYQARLDASIADQAAGGAGLDLDYVCMPPGMPRMLNVYTTMELLILPDTTYMLLNAFNDIRHIFTDGRDWPGAIEPSYGGYSIGRWRDTRGSGRFDTLEVETRGFRGPRTLDSSAIPLADDNQTVVKERLFGDAANRNVLRDEVTVIDHAFTHPWTVMKEYSRVPAAQPVWHESACLDENQHVRIGQDSYMLSADGLLMPTKKDQPPPDLRYFGKDRK
jgi:hypothetical protein